MSINELVQVAHSFLQSPDWGGIGGIAGLLSAFLAVALSPPTRVPEGAPRKKQQKTQMFCCLCSHRSRQARAGKHMQQFGSRSPEEGGQVQDESLLIYRIDMLDPLARRWSSPNQTIFLQGDGPMNQTRVLIIDDQPIMHDLVRCILTCWPEEQEYLFEIFSAFDGIHGLEQVRMVHPDIILLDVQMPRMNGQEVAQTLRALGNMTPILLMTGEHQNDLLSTFFAICQAFLAKPFTSVVNQLKG